MPPLAIAGVAAAAIGGGATLLASKKNSKEIKRATQAQTDSTAAQIAYQREADTRNLGALSPFMTRGNVAGDTINAALGLGFTAPQATALPGTVASPYPGGAPAATYPAGGGFGMQPEIPASWMPQGATTQTTPGPAQTPALAAQSAYEIFKQSTGYQSRLTEGNRSLASNYFGGNVGQSGAAVKAALRFGQDYASREFGNWLGYLGNQQGLGLGAASALAGVSQGSADRMGAISQNSADAAGAAAMARAQNQGALFTGLAGSLGQAVGALSSYRAPTFLRPALSTNVPAYGYG
jgi:hypothetical protein